ncbi:sentrin-specific protease 7-like [Symphorus nematophorus]
MMITENGIMIPLKGAEEGEVVVVASQVRGYGVWDGGVAQGGALLAGWKGPAPSLLFLWVTDAQANLLQMELSAIQTPNAASGPPCSCLLLVLKKQLQELQAALLASILDMEEYRRGRCSSSSLSSSSGGLTSPLEWTDGLLLLHSCPPPLDQHLLGLLGHSAEKSSQVRHNQRNKKSSLNSSGLQQLPTRLIQYPVAPCKGRITVTKEDLACLDDGEFLNDVIIDFYLKYLLLEGVGGPVAERSHVFSSFFYKQLSRRRAAGENDAPSVPDRHMRHQRVKTWTRHVDIFTKDFLFVPVNQEAHWFLVVVCFPGLEEVQYEEFQRPTGGAERAAGKPSLSLRSQQTPECTRQGCTRDAVLKRPCVLVMDSLKLSYHENVCRLLRDYLQVEWEVRRGTPRLFTSDTMRSSNCRVPQQDNSSDCGVFLLQYVESFLQNPVVHFDLPLRLDHWFPRQRVRQKREEIRSLVMRLHESQSEEN